MSTYGNSPNDPNQPPSEGQVPPPGGEIPVPPPPPSQPGAGQPPYGQPGYGQSDHGQAPPPPPPYGADGAPGGNARPFNVGEAFNYGWTKFQANIGPIILAVLAIVGVAIVIQVISAIVTGAMASASAPTYEFNQLTGRVEMSGGSSGFLGATFFVSSLFGMVTYTFSLIVQSGIIKGSLAITRGGQLSFQEMFAGLNFVQIIIASIIVGVATFVGLILCVLPGLVVVFFTWFTLYFVIDKNMPAVDAIKASISFVNRNIGTLIGFFLAALVAYFVGALLCGLGLLVAMPVVIIAQAYTFRTLQGETVAA